MRKILPILITATVLLTPLYPIYAQGGATPEVDARIMPIQASGAGAFKSPLSDQVMARKEKMATRAAELKAKLARFKDKAKAKRVENLNNNLNTVNTNLTTAMQNNLQKISEALGKLKTRAAEAEATGKDISSIKDDIAAVESSWAAADAAVKAQMEKDYTVVVNTESTIKADAQSARNTLRTDLKVVHDSVVETRKSLVDAVKNALSLMRGGNNGQ